MEVSNESFDDLVLFYVSVRCQTNPRYLLFVVCIMQLMKMNEANCQNALRAPIDHNSGDLGSHIGCLY